MTTRARGMNGQDEQDRLRQQSRRLLAFPGVGPLAAAAIARNLAAPPGAIEAVLETLVEEGRVVRTADGRFTLPGRERQP
jgi:hypothetical protein